jgi:hypothetical protein
MVDRAHAILNAEQQNMQKRVRDCDGCHDPKSPPVFSMLVEVSTAGSGAASKSMFMICRRCAARPIQLFLHGKGYCAPGVRVDEPTALGKADLDRPTGESGHRVVVEDTVEPPVEIIDKRYEDEDDEDDEDDDSEPPPPPPKRKRARARKAEPPSPVLDLCAACGHHRGFHVNGRCGFSLGRGCEAACRSFKEP